TRKTQPETVNKARISAEIGKECLQEADAFRRRDPVMDFRAVMALRMVKNPRPMPDTAATRITGAIVKHRNPGRRNRRGTHRARLKRDPEPIARQARRPRGAAGGADGQNLG